MPVGRLGPEWAAGSGLAREGPGDIGLDGAVSSPAAREDAASCPAIEGPASWSEELERAELLGALRARLGRMDSGDETLVRVVSCRIVEAASGFPLSFLAEMLEDSLGFRWRPMRPSFSMATKLVRTLDRGRGESEPLVTARAGWKSISNGC